MKQKIVAGAALAIVFGIWVYAASKASSPDMNDRIIADTAKCVQSGLEPEIERTNAIFGFSDQFIVVCKPPGGKESNLDRMLRQMGLPERGPVKKQTPPNPDSFETKSKVTQ